MAKSMPVRMETMYKGGKEVKKAGSSYKKAAKKKAAKKAKY